jgi:hypothetical protein
MCARAGSQIVEMEATHGRQGTLSSLLSHGNEEEKMIRVLFIFPFEGTFFFSAGEPR